MTDTDTLEELNRRLMELSAEIAYLTPDLHKEFDDWRQQSHTPAEIEQTIAFWQRKCDRELARQSRTERD
jgi:hypothetical protein